MWSQQERATEIIHDLITVEVKEVGREDGVKTNVNR